MSGKKAKRLNKGFDYVQNSDREANKVLHGARVPTLPPGRKTILKQLFAGQMGITVLAIMFGWTTGKPLDLIDGWDGSSRAGSKSLNREMEDEKPTTLVITHPCGAWGNFSRWNLSKGGTTADTVLERRAKERPLLKNLNDRVVTSIKDGVHIVMENPTGSSYLREPEMKDVAKMIEDGILHVAKFHGCMVGYSHPDTDEPHFAPLTIITDMKQMADHLTSGSYHCDGNHTHAHIMGSRIGLNKAEWPQTFNEIILQLIIDQVEIDTANATEALPAIVRKVGRPKKQQTPKQAASPLNKRIRGKQAAVRVNSPVAEVTPAPPERRQGTEEAQADSRDVFRHGLDDPIPPAADDDTQLLLDDALRNPLLPTSEKERRKAWAEVPAIIRKEIRKLHVNAGHMPVRAMMRRLRRAGATIEIITATKNFTCAECGEAAHSLQARPTRPPGKHVFNYLLWMDTATIHDVKGNPYHLMVLVCEGTSFGINTSMGLAKGIPKSSMCLNTFCMCWTSWAGWPQVVRIDRGKEWMKDFAESMTKHGVEIDSIPLEAPWQLGKAERRVQTFKYLWRKVASEHQVHGEEEVLASSTIITQVINETEFKDGFTAGQWVLGSERPRVPGSLLQDGEAAKLEVHEAALEANGAMAKNLDRRETTMKARAEMDNDKMIRRAVLSKSVPQRPEYPVGAYVYFKRLAIKDPEIVDQPDMKHKWYGVARVIGHEIANPDRLEDPGDKNSAGTKSHGVWLRYRQGTILAVPEQLRYASPEELLFEDNLQPVFREDAYRGPKGYVDIRSERDEPWPRHDDEEEPGTSSSTRFPHLVRERTTSGIQAIPSAETRGQASTSSFNRSRTTTPIQAIQETVADEPPPKRQAVEAVEEEEDATALSDTAPEPPTTGDVIILPEDATAVSLFTTPVDKRLVYNHVEAHAGAFQTQIVYPQALITKKVKGREHNYFTMDYATKKLFDESMGTEWTNWTRYGTVVAADEKMLAKIPQETAVIGMRWIHTDRNDRLRVEGRQSEHLPIDPKSRCVAQGCQEDTDMIRGDSPTASTFAFHLVCAVSALLHFCIGSSDAVAFYLQADGISRLLILKAPHPPPPGVAAGQLFLAKGSVYGTKDAGRTSWFWLRGKIMQVGFVISALERCLFFLFDYDTDPATLICILIAYVDDLLFGVKWESLKAQKALADLAAIVDLKTKWAKDGLTHLGRYVLQQVCYTITVTQKEASTNVEDIVMLKDRAKEIEADVTAEERSEYRSGIGSISHLARNGRFDLLCPVSLLAQMVSKAKVKHLLEYNKAAQRSRDFSEVGITFRGNTTIAWDDFAIFCNVDSAQANVDDPIYGERTKSQCGYLIGFCKASALASHDVGEFIPVELASATIKRVCRASLSSEANGAVEGVDALVNLREIVAEMRNPGVKIRDISTVAIEIPATTFIDAMSL